MKNPYKSSHSLAYDSRTPHEHMISVFMGDTDHDIMEYKATLVLKEPRDIVIAGLKQHFPEARVSSPSGDEAILIHAKTGALWDALVIVSVEQFVDVDKYSIKLLTHPDVGAELIKAFKSTFEGIRYAAMKWWYAGNHGLQTREVFMPPSKLQIHPEFYPDFDPVAVIDEYIHSDESVLIMAGPPGTGKTTLLREMIVKYKLNAHVIYDEKIMEKDTPFQSFLFDEDEDGYKGDITANAVMVIEDADTILLSREDDGNKMMSRFLSISDGLIKLPNRKLVFTTNLMNLDKIDDALLRPGRCFGIVHTRKLNLTEAQAAARVAGVTEPTEKGEYSLAEIFKQGTQRVKKIGFGFT